MYRAYKVIYLAVIEEALCSLTDRSAKARQDAELWLFVDPEGALEDYCDYIGISKHVVQKEAAKRVCERERQAKQLEFRQLQEQIFGKETMMRITSKGPGDIPTDPVSLTGGKAPHEMTDEELAMYVEKFRGVANMQAASARAPRASTPRAPKQPIEDTIDIDKLG